MNSFVRSRVLIAAFVLAVAGCGGSDGGSGGVDLKMATAATNAATSVTPGSAGEASTVASAIGIPTSGITTPSQPSSNGPIEAKISLGSEGREVDPVKPRNSERAPTPARITLADLPIEESRLQKSAPGALGAPQKVGVARAVVETATTAQTSAALAWKASARGGKVAAIRFASAGAQGVRLGVVVRSLPFGTFVRFYADKSDTQYEIPGQQILASINRNLEAGDPSDAARTYWSPNLRGAAVTMEIEIPASAETSEVDVAIPSISHFLVDTRKEGSIEKIGESGSCNLDVACTSTYDELSKSVALIEFQSGGSAYVCTGTLLNDRMSTGTPYFLTAKHCIPNQTVASTMATIWFYRASSCSSGAVSSAARALTQGATMLYVSSDAVGAGVMPGDTSFLRLNETPPTGALYAGSSSFPLAASTPVYGVHHPKGDVQKYSVGSFTGTSQCTSALCTTPASSSPNFMRVHWTQGVTEGGSSGSGIFTRLNGKDYLVGQLLGGGSSCSIPNAPDFYGRFDLVFNAALYQWLNSASTTVRLPIYRFFHTGNSTHFYTSSPTERDYIISKFSVYNYEGPTFYAYGANALGSSPVHRFYNNQTGAHFYTIDEQERQYVYSNFRPPFQYDGIAWYANIAAGGDASPMYRFYNRQNNTHFYTISAAERDYVQQQFSAAYSLEGVAYNAWTTP